MYDVFGTIRTRAFRVIWMLEELGQPYSITPAPPRSPEITAVNPLGKVPALCDGNAILTDSVAIMTYLGDKHGALSAPAGTLARARQDALTNYVIDEMDAVLWAAAKHSFVLPEEKRVTGLTPTLAWEIAQAVDHLAKGLETAPFLNGEDITLTDILATHCATWAKGAQMLPENPIFAEYLKRMMDRPAYERAQAAGQS